jgi:hypothetical protein
LFSAVIFFLIIKALDPELDPDPQLRKSWIRIRIKSMRIRNPNLRSDKNIPKKTKKKLLIKSRGADPHSFDTDPDPAF